MENSLKMPFVEETIEQLQKVYSKPAIRPEGDGYYLRKAGRAGRYVRPNLQIHVPYLGRPVENDYPIDLLRGFMAMSEIVETLNLRTEHGTGLLFCRNFRQQKSSAASPFDVCHIDLCDPGNAEYLLITVYTPRQEETGVYYHPNVWQNKSYSGYYCTRCDYTYYSLVPLGIRNLPDGQTQSPEDITATKRKVISLANRYLGIEDDTEETMPMTNEESQSSELVNHADAAKSAVSMKLASETEAAVSNDRIAGFTILNRDDGIHIILTESFLRGLPDNKPFIIEIN